MNVPFVPLAVNWSELNSCSFVTKTRKHRDGVLDLTLKPTHVLNVSARHERVLTMVEGVQILNST